MIKKLRDISIDDIIKCCEKLYCSDCPLAPYIGFDCSELRDLDNEVLNTKIEVPDNE